MSNTLISGYNGTFEVGLDQLNTWVASGAIDLPWYADRGIWCGSYVIVSRNAWFGGLGRLKVYTGYDKDEAYSKAEAMFPGIDSLYTALDDFWVANEYEIWHVVYDADLWGGWQVEVERAKGETLGVEFLQLGDFHGGREVLVHLSWHGETFAAIVSSWGDVDLVTDWQGSQPRTFDECKDYVWAILYDWEPVDGLTTDMVFGAVSPAFAGDVDFGCERAAASC